ncbi:MAG: 1,6-anhydro-N-acetylmuramyl-L-alanine amidase AmpD [Gammaproteobacteria bacterium]|nr:1,6-anhydro-N-acetylmuramyl-L-alanine amidase AmpD [Gammaproteobacteria bacterium]
MRLDEGTGIVSGADWIQSPNCDDRPPGITVDTLVIHAISLPPNSFGGGHVARLFTNRLDPDAHPYFAGIRHLRVSAHFFIDRQGALTQFVPVGKRAWHAGESRFRGRDAVNDFSIGVELEGCDNRPFEAVQYSVLTTLTSTLMSAYPALTPDRIMGHSDIAPERKTDPGPGFDWRRFLGELGS